MDDVPVHVTCWGDDGPTVVLIHGGAQGSSVGGDGHFSRQRELAQMGFQSLVPDRPGHGRSPSPGRPDEAEADAAWVVDLLGDGAHLVGHSFGACVALAAATRRPGAVRLLTLIEPGMQKLATDDPAVRKFGLRIMAAIALSWSPVGRAERFSRIVGIPEDIRGGRDREELARIGRGIATVKLPSAATLRTQLAGVSLAGIPFLVVTGGWNPAFGHRRARCGRRRGKARGDSVAALFHQPGVQRFQRHARGVHGRRGTRLRPQLSRRFPPFRGEFFPPNTAPG